MSGPQTPAWEPRWLDRKDERALVRAVERYGNPRDVALMVTLLQTGLRVGELVALELEDVELSPRKGAVTVRHGKRDRFREVPLNAEARRVFERYLEVRPTSSSARLFLGQHGPIGPEAVQRVARKYARLAQLEDVTPHTLRHTFAKRVLEAGTPAVTVSRLLGHGSVETTAIYTQPGWMDRVEAVERRADRCSGSNSSWWCWHVGSAQNSIIPRGTFKAPGIVPDRNNSARSRRSTRRT